GLLLGADFSARSGIHKSSFRSSHRQTAGDAKKLPSRSVGRGKTLSQRWPSKLWIVRHGESAGNVARDAANAAGLADIAIDARDVDVPLSPLGEQQSRALGRWFASMSPEERPDVVLSSPYLR